MGKLLRALDIWSHSKLILLGLGIEFVAVVGVLSEWSHCYRVLGVFNSKVLEGEFIVIVGQSPEGIKLWKGHPKEPLGSVVTGHFLREPANCEYHHGRWKSIAWIASQLIFGTAGYGCSENQS
jgi:hypothetical protein